MDKKTNQRAFGIRAYTKKRHIIITTNPTTIASVLQLITNKTKYHSIEKTILLQQSVIYNPNFMMMIVGLRTKCNFQGHDKSRERRVNNPVTLFSDARLKCPDFLAYYETASNPNPQQMRFCLR